MIKLMKKLLLLSTVIGGVSNLSLLAADGDIARRTTSSSPSIRTADQTEMNRRLEIIQHKFFGERFRGGYQDRVILGDLYKKLEGFDERQFESALANFKRMRFSDTEVLNWKVSLFEAYLKQNSSEFVDFFNTLTESWVVDDSYLATSAQPFTLAQSLSKVSAENYRALIRNFGKLSETGFPNYITLITLADRAQISLDSMNQFAEILADLGKINPQIIRDSMNQSYFYVTGLDTLMNRLSLLPDDKLSQGIRIVERMASINRGLLSPRALGEVLPQSRTSAVDGSYLDRVESLVNGYVPRGSSAFEVMNDFLRYLEANRKSR